MYQNRLSPVRIPQKLISTAARRVVYLWILSMALCCISSVAVQAAAVHENMLYQHSFFTGKHWERSSDTIDYNLSSGYTGLTPVKVSIAGNDTNNVVLFSTASNALYLMHALLQPPPTYTSNSKLTTDNPVESPVGSAGAVFGLFAYTSANLDIVFLAVVAGTDKIAVHHMIGASYTVFRTDTLTVSLPSAGAQVTGLYGGPALARGSQSCIWATGTHGLIRLFQWDGSTWTGETVYDIDTTETVTALSIDNAGTVSGKIYTDQAGVFVFNSQPTTEQINTISAAGAVCNNGIVLKKKGSQWRPFTVGSAHYTCFNFISRTDGSGVELLDEAWQFYKVTLEDTVTGFSVKPDSIATYINNTYYRYNKLTPETVTVTLSDPDTNYKVPDIVLNGTLSLTDTLTDAHPDTSCVPGFIDLADTTITLIISPDSVTVITRSREAAFNPLSYKYYWVYHTFTRSAAWSEEDRITIAAATQSLIIQNRGQGPTSIRLTKQYIAESVSLTKTAGGLYFKNLPGDIHALSIFNSAGRCLTHKNISPHTNSCMLPVRLSSGVYFIEYRFVNGTSIKKVLPVVQ